MWLKSQSPLHVQGDAGHTSKQGGGPEKNNRKKWRAEEEDQRHKGSLTRKRMFSKSAASLFREAETVSSAWDRC
jgi:hypothetical protein